MAHAETAALKRLAGLLVALLSPAALAAQSAGWLENLHLSAGTGVSVVDNYSRTSHEPSRKDDTTWDLSLASTHARQLAPSVLLIATAEASSLVAQDFELSNHLNAGGRLALQKKFGLGAQATVLQLRGGLTWKDARLPDDRGWTAEASVELAKRVLPNLRLAATAGWLEHNARRATFDIVQRTVSLDARWDINDRWRLAASASRLDGDIVANASWPVWSTMLAGGFGPEIFNYYTSRPWHVTHLFGPNWVSYNVEADVDLWSATLNYALSERTSVEFKKSAAFVENAVGVTYPTDSWGVALSHRF